MLKNFANTLHKLLDEHQVHILFTPQAVKYENLYIIEYSIAHKKSIYRDVLVKKLIKRSMLRQLEIFVGSK